VTIGGRAGPNQQPFTGAITEVQIARRRPGGEGSGQLKTN